MGNKPSLLQVGLAVGQGTGPELADVFATGFKQLARLLNIEIVLHRSPRTYHSYHSLFSADGDLDRIENETMQDAAHYEDFCREQAARGTKVIFRTAITAQSLYKVRQHLEAVKVEVFHNKSTEILLVRDQAQGFYTGSNAYATDSLSISRTCQFNKAIFSRIIGYAVSRARELWGESGKVESLTMVYKHHLFGGMLDDWARDWSDNHGLRIEFFQPDTMNRNILTFGLTGHQLVIAGNEYADIMEVLFLDMFGQGVQETSYSENIYLAPATRELVEYQTVHGSADDLTGKGIVNPSATLKALAAILERFGRCEGVEKAMDRTIDDLVRRNICTPDQGGSITTSAYVSAILHNFKTLYNQSTDNPQTQPPSFKTSTSVDQGPKSPVSDLQTALLVVDFQNDFAASINDSSPSLSCLTGNIARLLSHIRRAQGALASTVITNSVSNALSVKDIEIIHIRFFGDASHQSPPWASRNRVHCIPSRCISDTKGANFIETIEPQDNEAVFEKWSFFDPFMVAGFEAYLQQKGIRHLILVGLYGDVCIDTTARSAFQKGFWVSVVDGCIGNLHLSLRDWEDFAGKVYGARILQVEDFADLAATEKVGNGSKSWMSAKLA